jgi:hypothetical protein
MAVMLSKLTRRQVLRAFGLGAMGGLMAACAPVGPSPVTPAADGVVPTTTPAPTVALATEPPRTAAPLAGEADPVVVPSATPAAPVDGAAALATQMAASATAFLNALGDDQRAKATYPFSDAERLRWHWTTPGNFRRNGLSLREMNTGQRELAMTVLRSGVSEAGYRQALDIMSLQNDLGNDPELYFVTVFGTPGEAAPWGWRFEGHHYSRHATIAGNAVEMMPFFLGAWPTVARSGLRAMPREEDAARELAASLVAQGNTAVIFQERTLTTHVTRNEPYVSALDPVGVPASELNADQQALLDEIVAAYLGTLPESLAALRLEQARSADRAQVRFGWAGSLEPRRPHYYRVQGPASLLEFDNSRNGGTHIHSVWRDFAGDFGRRLLA